MAVEVITIGETKVYTVDDCMNAMAESIPFHLELEGQYTKANRIRFAFCYMDLMLSYLKDMAQGEDREAQRLLELITTDPEAAALEVLQKDG